MSTPVDREVQIDVSIPGNVCAENYYGNTFLQDQATAHFGNTYTSFHVHAGDGGRSTIGPQPLTASNAIAGLLSASSQAIEMIRKSKSEAPSLQEIQFELASLKIIVSGLNSFVNRINTTFKARAELIPVRDVVTLLTQLVSDFAELWNVLERLSTDRRPSKVYVPNLGHKADNLAAAHLLRKLHRHKANLTLVLQIIQWMSGTMIGAERAAAALRTETDRELDHDTDLATRIQQIDIPSDPAILGDDTYGPEAAINDQTEDKSLRDNNIESVNTVRAAEKSSISRRDLNVLDANMPVPQPFDQVVAMTRVYRRVQHMETDHLSVVSSTRSHGWSALSGISSSRITCISVICLPLHMTDVERFRQLAHSQGSTDSPETIQLATTGTTPGTDSDSVVAQNDTPYISASDNESRCESVKSDDCWNTFDSYEDDRNYDERHPRGSMSLNRILKELDTMKEELPPNCCASPLGHNVGHWQGRIMGPIPPTTEESSFDIIFPESYPFQPPRVRFRTRVYHPNINEKGQISLNILGNDWKPTLTAFRVLMCISALLDEPDPDNPLVPEIARVYRTDRTLYEANARAWTKMYAR